MNRSYQALVNICRIVMAAVLVFSGYVKAVDPLGTAYKIEDYTSAIGLGGILPEWMSVGISVGLSALEFSLGIFLLFAIQRRFTARVTVVFLAFMTIITLWLALFNPISDCGCFGDAVQLTNWQTLLKNVFLLACAVIVARSPLLMVRFISKTNQWIVTNYTIAFVLITSVWSLYDLPQFDFRPYHVGADIKKGMEIPDGAPQPTFETTFLMEKDGKRQEFTLENYPDSTWTFIDSKTTQTSEGYTPPIHDFSMMDRETGEDITEEVLADTGYTFLLIAPYLEKANDGSFGEIDQLYEYAEEHGYSFYGLTASGDKAIAHWRDITGAEYPFCITDGTTLKTMIRSNPGLMLLKGGKVIRKWSHNALPDMQTEGKKALTMPEVSMIGKILRIVLWFILPLLILTIADRMWAWTRFLKIKKRKNIIYQFKKKREMRKKIVAGNWKMNMNLQDGVALAKELNDALTADKPNCEVVICTPFIHLATVAQLLDENLIGLGAENCADKDKGAYTGEVSAEMVKSTGAQYVILGHSERRQYYNETPEILKEKVQLALANGLKVIFCIGETLEEREAEKQNEVVKTELEGSVFNLSAEEFKNIVIAYEPIWAIGTGKTATAEQAEEIHAYIRSIIAEKYGAETADNTTILYGGSCKASNAPELFGKPDIDGGLIGGASLKVADFKGIIDAWK